MILRLIVGPRDGYAFTAETQLYVNGFPLQAIDVWQEEAWLPPEYTRLDEIMIALRAGMGFISLHPSGVSRSQPSLGWTNRAGQPQGTAGLSHSYLHRAGHFIAQEEPPLVVENIRAFSGCGVQPAAKSHPTGGWMRI